MLSDLKQKKGKANTGFSLIELLVVISIIAVLSALGTVTFSGAQERARDTQRKSDALQIKNALQMCWNDNVTYNVTACDFTTAGVGKYMKSGTFPLDPKDKSITYSYVTDTRTADGYAFYVCLENKNDSQKDDVNLCTSPRVSQTFGGP